MSLKKVVVVVRIVGYDSSKSLMPLQRPTGKEQQDCAGLENGGDFLS
jgi:hypothetical protein